MKNHFSLPSDASIPLKAITVAGRLSGHAFTCETTQRYVNDSGETIEAIYTFPRAEDAVITEFSCLMDGVRRTARQPTSRVTAAYLDRRNGRLPLLLEANADGTATVSIGCLAPGKTVEATFRTHAVAAADNGRLTLVLPLCTGRLHAGPGRPSPSLLADYPVQCKVLLTGVYAAGALASASHEFQTERTAEGLLVRFLNVRADGNVSLTLANLPAENALVTAPDPFASGRWSGVLMLTPPAPAAAPEALDLDVLADDSGSMAGAPCRAAQEALAALATLLTPQDRVKLTTFGTECWPAGPRSAFDDAFRKTVWLPTIASLGAGLGGSNLAPALKAALEATAAPRLDARRAVLLVTDGKSESADELVAVVRAADAPVFILGVGRTSCAARLQTVAQASGGFAEFILPGEDALPAVTRLIDAARRPPVPVAASDALKAFLAACEWTSGFPKTVRAGLCHRVYFESSVQPALPVTWTASVDGRPKMTSLIEITEAADGRGLAQTVAKRRLEAAGDSSLVRQYDLLDNESGLLLQGELLGAFEKPAARFIPEMLSSEAVRFAPPVRLCSERPQASFLLERKSRNIAVALSQLEFEDPVHEKKARSASPLAVFKAAVQRSLPGKAPLPGQMPEWLEAFFADVRPGALFPEDPAEKDAASVQRWWTVFARRLPAPVHDRLCERLGALLGGEDAPVLSIEILAAAALVKAALVYYPTSVTYPDGRPSPDALARLDDLERFCGQDFSPWFKDAFLRSTLLQAIDA